MKYPIEYDPITKIYSTRLDLPEPLLIVTSQFPEFCPLCFLLQKARIVWLRLCSFFVPFLCRKK